MPSGGTSQTKLIRIKVFQHKTTNLLIAISDDLRGLMVPGRSHRELESRMPDAVREILEAEGYRVGSVTAEHTNADPSPDFAGTEMVANAEVEMSL